MSIEAWSILISAVIAAVVPLALWLISTHGKLSRIDERTSTDKADESGRVTLKFREHGTNRVEVRLR